MGLYVTIKTVKKYALGKQTVNCRTLNKNF